VSNLYIKPMLKYIAATFFALLMLPSLCFSTITGGYPKKAKPKAIFPEVTFEIQTASSSNLKEEFKAIADSELLSLRTIYYKYLNKGFDFKGEVLLKFTIAKNGEITKIDIMHTSTGNIIFDKTIKNKIATWKWNIKDIGATITVLFKFTTIFITHNDVSFDVRRIFVINGVRLFNDIEIMLRAKSPFLMNIRNKYFKFKPPDLDDIIVILKFDIAGSGEVTNVSIIVDTTECVEFEEDIKNMIVANWKWKSIEDGDTTVVVFYNL